ncbi:MAG TPA: carboxypeptidase-like regulatory domain-containing protein [Vicinamibacterales bacterium]|nr:carboxypeptidase-like regulatory domain-containing protein [Vicinamibacterales bacterium]
MMARGPAVVVALLLSVASGASAQTGVPRPPPAGLAVQVRDSGGRPVADAQVAVRDEAGRPAATATTAGDGVARVADLAPGTYTIAVSAPGFAPAMLTVGIGRGQLVSRTVTLAPSTGTTPRPLNPLPRPPGRKMPPAGAPPAGRPMRSGLPTGTGGAAPAAVPPATLPPDAKVFVPMPDRWNITMPDWSRYGVRGEYPYVAGHWWDPYDRNRLKGDYPVLGQQTFFDFTGVSDTLIEGRNLPTATIPGTERPQSEAFFGQGNQYVPVQVIRTSFDLFHGDTAFRPVDWRVTVQPAISLNYLHTAETGVVNPDVRAGTARFDTHVALQEAFVEKKLFDLGPDYDFISVRAGIQDLSTDFRGFVAVVEEPGVRVFGTLRSNRLQYNVAAFDFLEKDTNSGFNTFDRRHQQMVVANIYIQDFLARGYTTEFSYHYSHDAGGVQYDTNGFLVRPAPIGFVKPHGIRTSYFGWAGDGHIGRLNVSHAFYEVIGTDDFNPIAARPVSINAQMAAAELSEDRDWLRIAGSFFWASGDSNISDGTARGFDSILDEPVFSGGPFSVWNREGVRLPQTGTGLVSPFSLLPDLRTSKDEGQQNFVNPGIFIVQGATNANLTPKLRAFGTVSGLWFQTTAPLEALLFQAPIRKTIGVDVGGGVEYRPPLSDNIVLVVGASALKLGQGLRDIFPDQHYFLSVFTDLRLEF